MDRGLFSGESLMVLKLQVASWFITLEFTFFRGIAKRLHLLMLLGQHSCKCAEVVGNLWRIFYRRSKVIGTLWQICHRVSEGVCNFLLQLKGTVSRDFYFFFINIFQAC
jgi:hypothetical protein